MAYGKKTAIVIPCYNESKRFNSQEFYRYCLNHKNIHFIIVDDGSCDNTYDVIASLQKSNPIQFRCLRLNENSGKAEAVRQGFLEAFESDFEYIGYWDADLSTPLSFIKTFCSLLGSLEIQIVIGARVKLLGRKIERLVWRHYLGRIFATFASLILNIPIYDTQCGAKIFKNSIELKQIFSAPFSVKWAFDIELLARLDILKKINNTKGVADIAFEYPLHKWTHVPGSKIKIMDFLKAPYELIKLSILLQAPVIKRKYISKFYVSPDVLMQ